MLTNHFYLNQKIRFAYRDLHEPLRNPQNWGESVINVYSFSNIVFQFESSNEANSLNYLSSRRFGIRIADLELKSDN